RHTRFSRDWSSDVCSSDLERVERYVLRFEVVVGVEEFRQLRRGIRLRQLRLIEDRQNVDFLVEESVEEPATDADDLDDSLHSWRSEERRVGKEGRARGPRC